MRYLVYDLEVFPNLFLAIFYDIGAGRYFEFQGDRLDALREFLADNDLALIGFNNRNYDDQIIRAIVERRVDSVSEIHSLSKLIIEQDGNRRDQQLKRWYYALHPWLTIDLMQIKPESISGKIRDWSLKKHEIRVRWHDVRDLPFDPHKVLSDVEKAEVLQYCYNDVAFTVELWKRFNDEALDGDKISALTAFAGKIIEDGLTSDKDKDLVNQVFCSDTPRLGLRAVLRRYEKATRESAWKIRQNKPREIFFDPKEMIFPEIAFQGPKNTEYLSYLRSLERINVANIQYDPLARRETNREGLRQVLNVVKELQFEIGEAKFNLGVGGVHSAIPSIALLNRNILDADVTSYYPALILKTGRSPVGFKRAWIDNFRAMLDQRVEAKRAQDGATAAFLKICLNSQYGNLNSHTSEIFDPALALTVTINGQLALLMLAEMLYLAGFEILSINTDGVTTIVDEREDDAKAVCAQWEQRIGLQLEYANYSDYIARDVNNYCARYRNGGLKRKGWFGKGAGTTPSVLADGVIAYFLNGTSAEEFISAQDNLFDFLYAGRAQLKHVFWKNVPLQKNNRWYKSVDGQPIVSFRTLEEAASEKKGHKLSGSDSAVPVNRIEDPSVPADLDREHYIDEIVKVCNRIKERHVSKETGGGSLLDKAKKFAELGFHIVPKGTPQNPKANPPGRYDEIWPVGMEDFPWHRYNGFGAYSGPRDGIVAIDIDNVPLATAAGLFDVLKPKKHFETRRTKGHAYDVQKGLSRGSVLFKHDGDRLKRTGPLFARTNGFEILYGKDIVQFHGVHPSGDAYSARGTLQPLPDGLLNFLVQKLDECQPNIHEDSSPSEDEEAPAIDQDRAASLLSKFEEAANKDDEYMSKGGHLRLQEYNGQLQLAGRCIADHDGGNHENEMHVFVTEKGFGCHCFHQRCRADLHRWVDRISRAFVFDAIHQPPTFDISLLKDCHDDIIQAQATHFGSNVVIEAPTGSGKTRGSVLIACAALSCEYPCFGDDNKILIAVSSKSEMQNVIREFQDVLGTQQVSAHGIYAVEGKSDVNVGPDCSLTDAPENARVVVSHHTYLSRKGLSIYSYALMSFIDTKTYVIIDEADAWVNSQIISIPLGARSKTQTFRISQETRHVHVEHCPVMTLSGNCLSCRMNRYDMRLYTYNSDINVMEYKP